MLLLSLLIKFYLVQEIDYVQKAELAWDQAWQILHTEDGWRKESGSSIESGIVYSRYFKHIGKLFKLETFVETSPDSLFEELVIRCDSQPQWNATVLEARSLQVIDSHTDIYYSVAAEGAGGLVSSRDFVSLRHWKFKDGIIFAAGCAVTYPGMPPTKKHVRGENRPGGWAFKPVTGQPNRCFFCWIINTDLKGWIPQYAVDQALSGTLLDFTKHIKKHIQELS
ncbi:hypothetical protein LSH36_2059g00000 [Paralvinella palmiformis]|uniref:START domain-containing protein n=1 Tax=Paralvinella palmiformis TaxID=53620 RepID=A0AAD9MNZ4_9ANNE|nr:hypothetical protein LSH36_2059g00000 [Paralvinella palmiformis]